MTNLTLFYGVFIAQILILSVFFPVKIYQRMRTIQQDYPKSTHPKLYPKSTHFYQTLSQLFGLFNALIFILGCVIVYYIYEGSLVGEKGINPLLPWAYFMIQMIPMWVLNIFSFQLSKLMKSTDTRTLKSAELKPRGLFQYVSPILFSGVIIAYFAFVFLAFYLEGFTFKIDGKAFLMSAILLSGYMFFLIMTTWLIYGKKPDPYQSQKDRTKTISLVIKTYCFTMISCAAFMAFAVAVSTFDMKSLMPVAMSLFLQVIAIASTGYMLQNSRIKDIDFDVYRNCYSEDIR